MFVHILSDGVLGLVNGSHDRLEAGLGGMAWAWLRE